MNRMMNRMLIASVTLAVALCIVVLPTGAGAAADPDTLPTAEQVILRYIEALGGRAAIEALQTRVLVGRETTDLERQPPVYEVVPVTVYSMAPNSFLKVERRPDGFRCHGFDGTSAWQQGPSGITRDVESPDLKISWLVNPQNALRLNEYFPGLKVMAREYIGSTPVYVLEPAGLDRTYYALYFDADTGLLIRIGYYTELQDYRSVDGVKFPRRVTQSRKGGSTTYVFDLVAHNLPLDSVLFTAPTSASPAAK